MFIPNEFKVQADKLLKLAELAKLEKQDHVQKMILAASISNDPALAKIVMDYLQPHAVKELLLKFPFQNPTEEELYSNFPNCQPLLMGKVKNLEMPFIYPMNYLNQHCFVCGTTGSGKTNFLMGLALQVMKNCPVWIIDREKEDYRHLIRLNPNLLVFDAQESFIYNPFQVPPFVNPKHLITAFVSIFSKTNSLLDGSEALLTKAMYELFEERGIFKGSQEFPVLFDLLEKIKSYKFRGYSRALGYQDSIMNRLESYLIANPNMYSYSKGFALEDLIQKSFVLEIKGLGEKHGRFITNSLAYSLFLYRIAKGERGNVLRNLLIIDEGKWAVPPGFNPNIAFPPLANVLAQSREAGLGIVIADQTADLDPSIFVQSRVKVCFSLGSGEDKERIKKTMALSKEQADYIHNLDVGEAIVRIPKVDPFVIKVPKVRLG